MEIYFIVKFKPQDVREYKLDLVCATEREKFVVPIRAAGHRPKILMPDEVNFGICAVKSPMKKMLLIQNLGLIEVKFTLSSLHEAFTCPQGVLSLNANASISVEIYFTPNAAEEILSEIVFDFVLPLSLSNKMYIGVSGIGENVSVALSSPSLTMEPSFISLTSQNTVRIKNMGSYPIQFSFKSYSNSIDEENERNRLLYELNRMEAIEKNSLKERLNAGFYDDNDGDNEDENEIDNNNYNRNSNNQISPYNNNNNNSNENGSLIQYNTSVLRDQGRGDGDESVYLDDEEEELNLPPRARIDAAILLRKYRNLRLALSNDNMNFVDDIFEISPIEGEITIIITLNDDINNC